jgi:Right handed beta helix region
MTRSRLLVATAIAFVSLCVAPAAHAVAQRTFVRSDGLDSNPCSITSPCRSFTTAVAATAAGGEVVVLDSAGYGPVTLTQSVSIIAPTGVYAGISVPAAQSGVTINNASAVVVLRGLTINGQGGDHGIYILAATRVHVESGVVSRMTSNGLMLYAGLGMTELFVKDSIFRDNANYGLYIYKDSNVTLDHVRVERSGFNGIGVDGSASATLTIANSVIAANQGHGLLLRSGSSEVSNVSVDNSELTANVGSGIDCVGNGGTITLIVAHSTLAGNVARGAYVATSGGTGSVIAAFQNNAVSGNGASGIYADNAAVNVSAANNVVSGNTYGLYQSAGAVFETFSSNTVRNNGTNTNGTITTLPRI